jgi:hypothetical protein
VKTIKLNAKRESLNTMPGGTLSPGWFAISFRWLESKKDRRLATGRWCRIRVGPTQIFRVLRFNASLSCDSNNSTGGIVLDYDGWLELSGFAEEVPESLDIEITKARKHEYIYCVLKHPDPAYRLSGWLGVISVVLGLIGVALGLLSVIPNT